MYLDHASEAFFVNLIDFSIAMLFTCIGSVIAGIVEVTLIMLLSCRENVILLLSCGVNMILPLHKVSL